MKGKPEIAFEAVQFLNSDFINNAGNVSGLGRLCTQCGACAAVCPASCIQMVRDEKGNHWPHVETSRCLDCGLCLGVCSGLALDVRGELAGKALYAGHATDATWRHSAPTGGLTTGLLVHLVNTGYLDGVLVLAGPDNNDPFGISPNLAMDEQAIRESSGSRYCPTSPLVRLKDIALAPPLSAFAVVGLPCQIASVRQAMRCNRALARNIKLLVGLFCGHTKTLPYTQLLANKVGIDLANLARIRYRGDGWPGQVSFQDVFGRTEQISHSDPLVNFLWRTEAYAPARCLVCSDPTAYAADLAIGDAWLEEYANDRLGTNLVIVRTPAGEAALQKVHQAKVIKIWQLPQERLYTAQPHAKARIRTARQSARAWALGLCFREFRGVHYLLGDHSIMDKAAALLLVLRMILLETTIATWLLAHTPSPFLRVINALAWRVHRLLRRISNPS